MSKVKRFSLEERYGYQNRKVIYDKNADNDIELNNIYPIIDLLNQLDEQISDLQHRLKVAERTTKLACDYLNAVEGDKLYELCKDIYNDNDYLMTKMNYFKEQAESELKGEKL